jgi:hypothetical protein
VAEPLPETLFLKGADCWGWATWQRAWECFDPDGCRLLAQIEGRQLGHAFDFDGAADYTEMLRRQVAGANDSWAVRWHASAFLRDKLTLYPGRSLVENIGHDATGAHCGQTDRFAVRLADRPVAVCRLPLAPDAAAREAFKAFFRRPRRLSGWRRVRELLRGWNRS